MPGPSTAVFFFLFVLFLNMLFCSTTRTEIVAVRMHDIWRFSKIGKYHFGVPVTRIIVCGDLYWGLSLMETNPKP